MIDDQNYLKKELYNLIKTDSSIFDFLQSASLDGLWYWDLENPEQEWMSPGFWQTLGYEPNEKKHLSSECQCIIDQDDLKLSFDNFYKHCEDSLYPYDQVVRYKHKNGSTVWIRCRGMVIRDDTSKPIRMLGAYLNVTDIEAYQSEMNETMWRFKAIFEKGPIGVAYHRMIYDDAGNPVDYYFIDANQIYQELTGVNPVGKTVKEAFPGIENDAFDWIGTFGKVAMTGELIRFEQYLEINKRWYDVMAYQYKQHHFVAMFTEITERKHIERALVESEAKHSAMITNIADIIEVVDTEGVIRYISENVEKSFGWHAEELIGRNVFEFAHPEEIGRLQEDLTRLLSAENSTTTYECRNLCKDGQYKTIEITATNLSHNKMIDGVLLNYRDVSERKKAETALQEKENFLRAILETTTDGFWVVDLKGNIKNVNAAYCRMSGYTKEELLSMKVQDIEALETEYDTKQRIKRVIQNGAERFETRHIRKDGSIFDVEISVTFMDHDEGLLVCFCHDITERKRAEEKIAESNERFQQISETVEEVFYLVTPDSSQMLFINPAYETIWGKSCQSLYDNPLSFLDSIHDSDR